MGLFWASKYCSDVDFVLKVNDDVWVNAPRFLDYFESNVHQNHFFGGKCVMGQPDRNRNSPSKSSIIKFCSNDLSGILRLNFFKDMSQKNNILVTIIRHTVVKLAI